MVMFDNVAKAKLIGETSGVMKYVFDRKSHDLKQWIVTDAQGLNTSVAIYNVSTGKQPDPGLFKITYLDPPRR